MKKFLPIVVAFIFASCIFILPVGAKSQVDPPSNAVSDEVSFDVSGEISNESSEESQIVIPEHPNKKYTPAYIAIGLAGAASVLVAAVVISKKVK